MTLTRLPSVSTAIERATFGYRALRPEGGYERGQVTATDRETALSMLAARGLFPIVVTVQRERHNLFAPRIPAVDLAAGFRILATLLDSGLPVRRAASIFVMLAPPSWSPVAAILLPTLREGRSLSAALVESGATMPGEIVGILRAGEAGGTVPAAMRSAADLAQATAATRSAIRAALAYPAVLAVAGAASISILVTIVLPRFATILADLNQTLPPSTRFVLDIAALAHRLGTPVLVGLVCGGGVARLCLTNVAAKIGFHRLLLGVPLIGSLRRAAFTGRACATLGALLEAGVSIAPALAMTAAAVGDAAISDRILRARASVIAGQSLGVALQQCSALTTSSLRLIRAGEETGRLVPMLGHAAQLERERATDSLRRLVRLLEPTLILVFAGVVAFVGAALMQAVYSVRPL